MTEDQLETWAYKMIRACNRSTSDSDINAIKLDQHIKNLYEQGRADEREACAKLCEDEMNRAYYEETKFLPRGNNDLLRIAQGASYCVHAIRARGEK